jgi:hypothetical protein
MTRPFYLLVVGLSLATGVMLMHAYGKNMTQNKKPLLLVAKLTHFTSPAFSSAYYEPRKSLKTHMINPAYIEMLPINRMDFVYEK